MTEHEEIDSYIGKACPKCHYVHGRAQTECVEW